MGLGLIMVCVVALVEDRRFRFYDRIKFSALSSAVISKKCLRMCVLEP